MAVRQCVVIPVIERTNGMIMTPSSTEGGFYPRVIVEGQIRYSRLPGPGPDGSLGSDGHDQVWGPTLADAQRQAAAQNRAWGLTDDDVLRILIDWQAARDREDRDSTHG